MLVTMKDIAKKAGVTQSAVSAVLNITTGSRVSAQTRERILRISRELNYRRNFAATALKKQKTGLLGFICGGMASPYYSELTTAITAIAAARGYRLILTLMSFSNKLDMNYLDSVLTDMCDGIIMCRELDSEKELVQDSVHAGNIPFVMLGSEMDDISSVSFDYHIGMRKAFEELLSNGHKRIAFAGHIGDSNKLKTYRECCLHYNCEPKEYCIRRENSLSHAFELGCKIANHSAHHSALITTDYTLSIVYPGMHSVGLKIPDNLSVVAFNNTGLSRCFIPALTSISLDSELIARYGVDMLIDLIDKAKTSKIKSIMIPPELICRDSVLPCQN